MQETIHHSQWKIVENDKNTCSWIGGASMGPSTPSQGILVLKFVFMQTPNVSMETHQETKRPAIIYKRSPNHSISKCGT